ncbi:MAG TPA: imidazole glycerol phosphate synthase subunit HisH [Candidatus Omnitrophota bacterium]|nr:imidazole glycerol phosphate synthase subunit HisH [Candidatus Omnitrophota bacterium]
MNVVIIDYNMGNLGSVRRSFEECGAQVTCSQTPSELRSASKIVLPGVGSFYDGMQHLNTMDWIQEIRQAALVEKIPLLGICLGMQLLADHGTEGGNMEGLGLIPGKVEKLSPPSGEERLPHVGWNEISITRPHPILSGIQDRDDFYFVHSYHFRALNEEDVVAQTPYCGHFTSVVAHKNILGTQFHPEKSSKAGFRLIRNFLSL